jgi:hypothetical protein
MKGPRGVTSRLILVMPLRARKRPRPAFRGRSDGKRSGPATAGGGYFPPPDDTRATRLLRAELPFIRLCIARQNSRRPPSSAALRPLSLRSAVQARSARRRVIAGRPR